MEDFQRLIKLAYGTTYIEDGGQELSIAQLIESMEKEGYRIQLPVWMVQGFPRFLSVIRGKNGKVSVALSLSFQFDKEDAFAPRMTGKQDALFGGYSEDMKRCGFAFQVSSGQFGSKGAKRFLVRGTDHS